MTGKIILYDENRVPVDLTRMGVIGLNLNVPSPSYNRLSETLDNGRTITLERQLNPRELKADFMTMAYDYRSSLLLRDELYNLFNSNNEMYISHIHQIGKLWKVDVNEWESTRANTRITGFELPLYCESGTAESLGTTLDPLTFPIEKWQTGQGLILEEPSYVQSATTFNIFNASDISIDPRKHYLKIEFKGASNNLAIVNNTTGDIWYYNGVTTLNDTILLDGVRSTKNGQNILKDSSKQLISLAKGWNNFTVNGTTGTILTTFDFRFHYL